MSVLVEAGFAICSGGMKLEESQRTLVLQAADATYDRIDTVVLRWNDNDSERICDFYVVPGIPASTPVRPALTRTESVWELGLADLFINAASSEISNQRITDTRYESERCGVISAISEFDTTKIYQQVQADLAGFKTSEQADFVAWFEHIKEQLSEDVAGHLQLEIDAVKAEIGEADISDIGDGTIKGAIAAQNDNFANQISELNNALVASDNTQFRFGVTEDGKYGYIVTDEEGADSVVPFSNPYLKFDAENGGIFALDDTGEWILIYTTDTLPVVSFDGILYESGVYSERYGTDYVITSGKTTFNPSDASGIHMCNSISNGTSSGLVCLTTPINCQTYTRLNVTVKTTSRYDSAPGNGSIGFGLTTDATATSGLVKTSAVGTNTTKTHTFDVTDYDKVYLYMYNYQNSSISDTFYRNQWITKIEITK